MGHLGMTWCSRFGPGATAIHTALARPPHSLDEAAAQVVSQVGHAGLAGHRGSVDGSVAAAIVRSSQRMLLDLGPESLAHLTAFMARQVCVCACVCVQAGVRGNV